MKKKPIDPASRLGKTIGIDADGRGVVLSRPVVPIDDRLKCLRHELNRRLRVYPGAVKKRQIRKDEARRQILIIAAIIDDYSHITDPDWWSKILPDELI